MIMGEIVSNVGFVTERAIKYVRLGDKHTNNSFKGGDAKLSMHVHSIRLTSTAHMPSVGSGEPVWYNVALRLEPRMYV